MSQYHDFLASKKEVRAAKVKRDASILALEHTCAQFNSISTQNPNVRIFAQIDNEYERNMQVLRDDNVTFTHWILHASSNFRDDPDFIDDQSLYNKASLDAMQCRDVIYEIIASKGLFPEEKPHVVEEGLDIAAILEKLSEDAKKDREVHASAMKAASDLAAAAAKAQTAALVKLKPAGIKLICNKFDGGKDRHQYKQWFTQFSAMIEASIKLTCNKFDGGKDRHQYNQWFTQFTAMIEAGGVEDDRVKSVNDTSSPRWSCIEINSGLRNY